MYGVFEEVAKQSHCWEGWEGRSQDSEALGALGDITEVIVSKPHIIVRTVCVCQSFKKHLWKTLINTSFLP